MKLWNVGLDIIALTPEQLAREQFLQRLPLIAVLVIAAAVAAALVIRHRKK